MSKTAADQFKEAGNQYFQQHKYAEAIDSYTRLVQFVKLFFDTATIRKQNFMVSLDSGHCRKLDPLSESKVPCILYLRKQ